MAGAGSIDGEIMAVRYPGRATDEGTAEAPQSPDAREPRARDARAARPAHLPRHTPARGTTAPAESRAGDAITCMASPAAAPLVREALALALPGVAVTVETDRAASTDDETALAPAWTALRRTQQLVAASDAAMRLQHALANPLTALLFEAQLLEMDDALPPELAEAVGRILTQCRRTIEVARRLDAAGAGPASAFPRHDIRNPM
jgi:signal transduction histidine kinase